MHGDVSHWIELGLWTRPSDKRVREANDDLIRDKGKVQRQRDGLAAKGSRSLFERMATRVQEGQRRGLLCQHQAVSDDFKDRPQTRSGYLDG